LATCKNWFWDLWGEQKVWVEDKLTKSDADWKIIVTHFPCGFESAWFATLHQKYGLDLLVTGHRHDQELWSSSSALGGLTCFVTGGGGGITSEASPRGIDTHQYGFFDLKISKAHIKIECINIHGVNIGTSMVYPRRLFDTPNNLVIAQLACLSALFRQRGASSIMGCAPSTKIIALIVQKTGRDGVTKYRELSIRFSRNMSMH